MTKPRFSFERHKDVGSRLRAMRSELIELSVEIRNAYPLKSKVYRLSDKPVEAIDQLRSALYSQLFEDCPNETAGDGWKDVDY